MFKSKNDINKNKKTYCSEYCKRKTHKSVYHHYLNGVKKRAIKTNKDYDLDETFIKKLLEEKQKNKCNLTNITIEVYDKKYEKSLAHSASLDRIDSNLGYTKDNVQWISLGINYMKLDYDESEVHELLSLIQKNYNVR